MIHRLKETGMAIGFNQTDFAKHPGITQTVYSMIKNVCRPWPIGTSRRSARPLT